jgi:hypothetical protein
MAVMDYRTQDGLADYGFAIETHTDGGWRAYMIFEPFYEDRDDNAKLPHQAIDSDGRRYVNWPSKLGSLGEARTVAGLWAELIHRYRCTQRR